MTRHSMDGMLVQDQLGRRLIVYEPRWYQFGRWWAWHRHYVEKGWITLTTNTGKKLTLRVVPEE